MAKSRATQTQIANHYAQRLAALENEHRVFSSVQHNFPDAKTINILSIGCGEDPVEPELIEELFKQKGLQVKFVGIDIDNSAIKECQKKYANKDNFSFQCIDGVKFNKIAAEVENGQYHIIIDRHPVFVPNSPFINHFRYIFSSTVPYLLASGGTLVTSIYGEEEREPFLEVIKTITDAKPVQLRESKTVLAEIDRRPTFFRVNEVECYADRFVYAYPNFSPNKVIQIEKENSVFYPEAEQANSLRDALIACLKESSGKTECMKHFLKMLISKTAELAKKEMNEADFVKTIALAMRKIDLSEVKSSYLSEPLDGISWNLIKQGTNEENLPKVKTLCSQISTMALRIFKNKPDNIEKVFEQGLIMLGTRPILRDLFPAKKHKNDEPAVAKEIYFQSGFM